MERFFTLDKFNTFYDWDLILTDKDVTPPEPKTNYVNLDGANGTLDLSEALTGEITYEDREVVAKFWTDHGTRKDREMLLKKILTAIHGKKIKIVDPDDQEHYLYGRARVKGFVNTLPYMTLEIEATCEPWKYAIFNSYRSVEVTNGESIDLVINNNGVKTLSPVITVVGTVTIGYKGSETTLTEGSYKISDLKLYHGANVVTVSGVGSVTFEYREADL